VFACMIMSGALLLLVRSMCTALLAMRGGWYVAAYYASDMSVYFVYKAIRSDLWHWVPLEGWMSVLETIIERVIVKVLVDFTGVIQFRAPGELGGCYFGFNTVRVGRPPTSSFPESYPLARRRYWDWLRVSSPPTCITPTPARSKLRWSSITSRPPTARC
jgi:hypothetical protein